MHAIHLSDLHLHANPNWFVVSVGGIVGFGICLFAFVVSLMGGDEFIASLGGYVTLAILVAGLIASVVATFVTMPEEGFDSLPRS